MVRYRRVSVRFRCVLGRISARVLRKLRNGRISNRPFGRSAGGSGARFFMKKSDFCNFFFRFGYGLESPGVACCEMWVRSNAISPRFWPHFGAGPSYFTLWWDFEGAVQAVCRRFWDSIFMKNLAFAKSILRLWGCPRIT